MSAILLLIVVLAGAYVEADETCDRALDLAFVVDGSSTVCGGTQPCDKWNAALQFCKDIISSLTIGPTKSRVAFITLFNGTEVEWGFTQYSDKASLLTAVDNVKYRGGELVDIVTFAKVITDVFSPLKGDRVSVQNVMIVISDGAPNFSDIENAAESFVIQVVRDVVVFIVCATPGCTEHSAQGGSSPPKKAGETYFLINNYLEINKVKDPLVKNVCGAQTTLQTLLDILFNIGNILNLPQLI